MDLNILWFLLLGVLLAGYAALDGFDFGVGMLSALAPAEQDRRTLIQSIGPFWDGNEVWLVTFGGAMLAAFPEAYATVFSGFYVPFMAVLLALILRAVSLVFRNRLESAAWRRVWDVAFSYSSLLASLLFGIAVGAAIVGLPLDAGGIFRGDLRDIVFPPGAPWYPLLAGAMTVALFTMHGGLFLLSRVEGPLVARIRRWVWSALCVFVVLYLVTTVVTLATIPRVLANFQRFPWVWAVVAASVAALALILRGLLGGRPWQSFAASSALVVGLVGLVGFSLFPDMVVSRLPGGHSLTIYNAASSQKTLVVMTIIAGIGFPLAAAYMAILYRTFRGRVRTPG
jgi:cytochrome bd ubiquinol oxidase subunit II